MISRPDDADVDVDVQIGLLGPLQVRYACPSRVPLVLGPADLGGRKAKQVLEILLVHRGQAVPKDRIAEMLWGRHLPTDPMRTLEAYVSGLRVRLGAGVVDGRRLLRSEARAYRLAIEDVALDAARFDALLSRAATAPIQQRLLLRDQAIALVRGEVLADEPYAEWAFPLRELYTERHLHLLLDLAEDSLRLAEPEPAARYAESVLAAQPARERAHRLLITARYWAGEQDLALEAYRSCRRVLRDELGVRPLAETERVFRAVLNHEPVETLLPPVRARACVTPRTPATRFARNGEATIAYQVLGDGHSDVVFAHAWFSHMEIGWEEPRYAAFLRQLARNRRLIVFDRRGMGMSDPAPVDVGLDQRADDIRAVMDDAGSGRAELFGSCGSGPVVMALAAQAPERVKGLILFGTYSRMLAAADYPAGWTQEFFAQYMEELESGWTTGRGIHRSVPTAGDDEALMEWLSRLLRLSASPAAARATLEFGATIDVRHLLHRIVAPTLVLHRRDDQWVHPDNGRYLAAHIPEARFVEIPGADHWPWFGDSAAVLSAVEQFLAGLRTEGLRRVGPRT